MSNQELNTALYEKMFAEQEIYRKWLLTQPPEKILNHTYEYTIREDILPKQEAIWAGVNEILARLNEVS